MSRHISAAMMVLLATAIHAHARTPDYEPSAGNGSREVVTLLEEWKDAKRSDRVVPVKIYYPKGSDACATIIFSHGLGGTRDGYKYVGEYWASHGFISVHLQHEGSDDAVWKDAKPLERLAAMKKAAANPMAAMDRPRDVSFAIDMLEKLNKDEKSPLFKRIDPARLGMSGHSFGGWTTLAVGGQSFVGAGGRAVPGVNAGDKRIKAMIPMSAPPGKDPAKYAESFKTIRIPALHMTGTLDESIVTTTTPEERTKPYEHTPGPKDGGKDQYLINFEGGDHSIFSGATLGRVRGGKGDPKKDPTFHKLIKQSTLAFWDAYLRDNAEAKKWLQEGGLKMTLGADAKLEMKK